MQNLKIDTDRLWDTIHQTAKVGATADGGVKRLTLSDEDRIIRDWFKAECEALGCSVVIDEIGNMFAIRPGRHADVLPIAMGSHLDTQPTGGKFDGILGVLSGLEVLRSLNDNGIETERSLMLVNWTNEEGARFAPAMLGSAVYAGVFDRSFADSRTDENDIRFGEALEGMGYRGTSAIGKPRFAAMFELHIEQGPVLEQEKLDIGVVTGVQAMRWYDLTIRGREAHAGTTPMNMRVDAMAAAANIILASQAIANEMGGLATTGQISITDASRNVIPGKVSMTLDLRHEDDDVLQRMESRVAAMLKAECDDRATLTPVWNSPAVHFDADCLEAIRNGAQAAGATMRDIVSGAGHDSVNVSKIAPTAMIFVPCKDGLSHNPAESSTKTECAIGAQVLLNAVLAYDEALKATK